MRVGVIPDDAKDGRFYSLCYPWDQRTLGMAGPLDEVHLEDPEQRLVTVARVKLWQATAHARAVSMEIHPYFCTLPTCLAFSTTPWGSICQKKESETPNSFPSAKILGCVLPALLHLHDGRMKRRERFVSLERGDVTLLLPWLMGHTHRASIRRRKPAHRTTD